MVIQFWSIVPLDPEPREVFEDAFGGGFGGALLIGVFDSQEESAVIILCECPAQQSGAGATDVEVPCRGGRESGDGRIGSGVGHGMKV